MKKNEWSELLFKIYGDCRGLPHWRVVFNCHDEEDQDYFLMLDELEAKT
jgi:hypothetical protein